MAANDAGEPSGIRRKRRPKNGCPNPLFARWVEEWRDEAKEKGLKSHHSYTKVSQIGTWDRPSSMKWLLTGQYVGNYFIHRPSTPW